MNETISGEPISNALEEGWYDQALLLSVYMTPSLLVYTGTQNRPHTERRSKGNDQIIHAMRVIN